MFCVGDLEIDALRRKLEETEAAMERIVKQMILASECNGMEGNKVWKICEHFDAHALSNNLAICFLSTALISPINV